MIAHVLCSGPSLKHTWQGADVDDVVIGANRAAQFTLVHWLCAGDWETPLLFHLPFTVGICTQSDCIRYARDPGWKPKAPYPRNWKAVAWEDLPIRVQYSGPTALLLAAHLGAKVVNIYGADMIGHEDFTGGSESSDRDENRWIPERRLFDQAVMFCLALGIRVHRRTKSA